MSRGARVRLALAALALVAILFVFVFPTRSYLAQRRQVSTAQHDVDVLRDMTGNPWEGRRAKITNDGTTNAIGG